MIMRGRVSMVILYHGTEKKFNAFDLKHMGKGNDEVGPGIYLSVAFDVASHYGEVMKVEIDFKEVKRLSVKEVDFMIDNAPNLEDDLTNWAEDRNEAIRQLKTSILDNDTLKEVIKTIHYELYKYNNKEFCINMVRLGYDCLRVENSFGDTYVFYNVDKLNNGLTASAGEGKDDF